MPGVPPLVLDLARTSPLVVVTNGPRHLVEDVLAGVRIRQHFRWVLSAESVARPKPSPDVYLAACDAAGVAPADAVAFEDSLVGVRAALAAGLRVVGVSGTVALPADIVVPSLEDSRVRAYLGL
jgi:HAD superfamily hydrolase (TIGR01509 family)